MNVTCKSLRPILGNILILPDEPVEKVGAIIIPKTAKNEERCTFGTVISMGPGMPTRTGARWPMPDIKPGDRVIFRNRMTQTVDVGGKEHVIVSDEALEGVLEP